MGSVALRIGKVIWIYDYVLFFRPLRTFPP